MSAAAIADDLFALKGRRVFVAGHRGMVGSAIVRRLAGEGCEVLTVGRSQVDLRRQQPTEDWMKAERPDVVIVAAATVGGILANSSRPADFIYDNLAIEANLIHAAHQLGVAKLLFLGSSCIYPQIGPAADERGRAPDRPARADERVVCHRQDRRHQALPGLSQAVWREFHLRHADQSLRTGRQLRPGVQPCGPGPHAQDRRGPGEGGLAGRDLGHRARPSASSSMSRIWPMPASFC